MNAASIERSPRLQRVLNVLKQGGWIGTRDIIQRADVCAVNSCISEIRNNGIPVDTRCVGQGRYEYRISQPEQGGLFNG